MIKSVIILVVLLLVSFPTY
ncbi:type I toxin-antitoxin system Ibs family toxin [Shigella flexneri]|nr:type I toxin-antitoxin system Ibs family toxin [Shigella flexneri]